MTHKGRYGTEPFEKVTIEEFSLNGLESASHAAFLQYKVLLIPEVVRANISFPQKKLKVIVSDPSVATKKILAEIKPVRATLTEKGSIDYDTLVAQGFHDVKSC